MSSHTRPFLLLYTSVALADAPVIDVVSFASLSHLVSCLSNLSHLEADLTCPIPVYCSDKDHLLLLSLGFPSLNLLFVLPDNSYPTYVSYCADNLLFACPFLQLPLVFKTAHIRFLQTKHKRMKTWVGLNSSLSLFEGEQAQNKTKNHYYFPPGCFQMWPIALVKHSSLLNSAPLLHPSSFVSNHAKSLTRNALHEIDHSSLINPSIRKFYIDEFLIESWYFPSHILSYDELLYLCFTIFKRIFAKIELENNNDISLIISDDRLWVFLFKVRELYHPGNNFHNFRHAVDVLQAVFYYCTKLNLLQRQALISKKCHQLLLFENSQNSYAPAQVLENILDMYKVINLHELILINEHSIENNKKITPLVDKLIDQLDPIVEYQVYCQDPEHYINADSHAKLNENIGNKYDDVTKKNVINHDDEIPNEEKNLNDPIGDHKIISSKMILLLFISALGHDSGHPGVTNNFLIKHESPLSYIFDKKSVLENYHYDLFEGTLSLYYPELLDTSSSGTSSDDDSSNFSIIRRNILATDMEQHSQITESLYNYVEDYDDSSELFLPELLLKCADISNITRPLKLSVIWGTVLNKEMQEISCLEDSLDDDEEADNEFEVSSLENILAYFRQWASLVNRTIPEKSSESDCSDEPPKTLLNNKRSDTGHFDQFATYENDDVNDDGTFDVFGNFNDTNDNEELRNLTELTLEELIFKINGGKLSNNQIFFMEKISLKFFKIISSFIDDQETNLVQNRKRKQVIKDCYCENCNSLKGNDTSRQCSKNNGGLKFLYIILMYNLKFWYLVKQDFEQKERKKRKLIEATT